MDIVRPESANSNIPEKVCSACGKSFPATPEYFHRNKINKDGLQGRCKTCIKVYQNSPEVRERIQTKKKDYRNRPDIKAREQAREKEYRSRPEVQERNRIRDRARHQRPERQAWRQAYYSRPDVLQHVSDYNKVYHEAYYSQPENREHKRDQDKAHYHKPEIKERERIRRKEYNKEYCARPEAQLKRRVNKRNRDARKKAIAGCYTTEQIEQKLKAQKHKCYYCSAKFEKRDGKYLYHIDHTFPLSRVEGTDIPANSIDYLVLACPSCNMSKNDKFPWEWPQGGRLL